MRVKISPLDRLFSEFIRKRAMARVGGCERCGSKRTNYKELECAHCHGRRKGSVRYDPDNALGLCYGCHSFIDSQYTGKVRLFKGNLGEEKFEHLEARMSITHPKPDKKLIAIYLRQQIKELEG